MHLMHSGLAWEKKDLLCLESVFEYSAGTGMTSPKTFKCFGLLYSMPTELANDFNQ
jgi:hypothetical protein